MILAGGLSTRLYPLTLDVPKALVPVLDRPVVSHVIDYLAGFGVDDLVINVHYFAAAVEKYVGDGSAWNVRMDYLREPQLMGSAGAVKQVEARFSETFVVIGCDDVTNIDLAAAVSFHKQRGAEATIVLAGAKDVSHYGVVVVDDTGRILGFQEKPAKGSERSNLVNTGVYVFEPAVLRRIPPKVFFDFGSQVFPEMLRAGANFYGMRQDAYWCDIGTPHEYRRVHADALRGTIVLRPAEGSAVSAGVLLGAGAAVDPSASIGAPTCVGSDATIGAGALVSGSVLWRGVRIGYGAIVNDAVLGENAVVEAGSFIEGGEYGSGVRLSTECTGRVI
ncbi:MAG: NDP-sugar synthase [Candidatus Eremiobacteraeota bacterium]|nr:NDP-sugar synthase [Candidatus Eremiobacteraeota bacterium]MBC5827732.1 NDP-sugar synthase [Candidatus Eremiobacteraeota bacterium]